MSNLKTVSKLIAIVVFITGAALLISATVKKRQDKEIAKAAPFALTYQVTKTEPGKAPVVIGLIVQIDNGKGGMKHVRFLDNGDGNAIREEIFYDATASYKVRDGYLEYVDSREGFAEVDQNARSSTWATSSSTFLREETILGMKAYVVHQETPDGYWEGAYSPLLARTPLRDREVVNGVETVREATAVQFRPVSDEEVAAPNLPVRFEKALRFAELFRASGDAANVEVADKFTARMNVAREKLRGLGRTE